MRPIQPAEFRLNGDGVECQHVGDHACRRIRIPARWLPRLSVQLVLVELIEAALDHAPHRFGQIALHAFHRFTERAALAQVPHQVGHEERIAFGAAVNELRPVPA